MRTIRLLLGLAWLGVSAAAHARSPLARVSPCGSGADDQLAPTGAFSFRTRLPTPLVREWTIAPLRPPNEIDLFVEGARVECRAAEGGAAGCSLVLYAGDPRLGGAELLRLPRPGGGGGSPPAKLPLSARAQAVTVVLVVDDGLEAVDVSFKVSYAARGVAAAAGAPAPADADGGAPAIWREQFDTKALAIPERWAAVSDAARVGGECGGEGEAAGGRALVFGGPYAAAPLAATALLSLPPAAFVQFGLRIGRAPDAGGDASASCGPGSGGALVEWAEGGRGLDGPWTSLAELGTAHPSADLAGCFGSWADVSVALPLRSHALAQLRWAGKRAAEGGGGAHARWALGDVRIRAYGTRTAAGFVPAPPWTSARDSDVVADSGGACLLPRGVVASAECAVLVVALDARGEPRAPRADRVADGAVKAWLGLAADWRGWPRARPLAPMRPVAVELLGAAGAARPGERYAIRLGLLNQTGLVPVEGSAAAAAAIAADAAGALARLALAVTVAGQHVRGSPFEIVVLPTPAGGDAAGGGGGGGGGGACPCECSGASSARVRAHRGPPYYVGLIAGVLLCGALLAAILVAMLLLNKTQAAQRAAATRAQGYADYAPRAAIGGGELRPTRPLGSDRRGALEALAEGAAAAAADALAALSRALGGRAAAAAGAARRGGELPRARAAQPAAGSLEEQRQAAAFFASTAASDALHAPYGALGFPAGIVTAPPPPPPPPSSLGLLPPAVGSDGHGNGHGYVASPLGALPSSLAPPARVQASAPPAASAGAGAIMESDDDDDDSDDGAPDLRVIS